MDAQYRNQGHIRIGPLESAVRSERQVEILPASWQCQLRLWNAWAARLSRNVSILADISSFSGNVLEAIFQG